MTYPISSTANQETTACKTTFSPVDYETEPILRVIPLGGVGEIGKNMMVLECQGGLLVIGGKIRDVLADLIYKQTGRRPMILPLVLEV